MLLDLVFAVVLLKVVANNVSRGIAAGDDPFSEAELLSTLPVEGGCIKCNA